MDARQRLYVWLTGIFVTSLLVADITGSKLFHFSWFRIGDYEFVTHSVGNLSFPLTFVLTDIVNEFYGKRATRRLTLIGLCMAALAFLLIYVARLMPTASVSLVTETAFEQVFGMSNRLYVASLTAFLVGQLTDIAVFGFFKRLTNGRYVWLRATGSTLVSQVIDSLLVTFILFANLARPDGSYATVSELLYLAATGYVLKFLIAVALTPVIYLVRWLVRTRLGLQPLPVEGAEPLAPSAQ